MSTRQRQLTHIAALGALMASACIVSQTVLSGEAAPDWTESGGRWSFQSYLTNDKIQQEYTFTPAPGDKKVGESSVEVRMRVAPEREEQRLELRYEPQHPLDLSQVEAIEVWLKNAGGADLKPRDVYLCNPGFQKLTIVSWPDDLDLSKPGEWQRVILNLWESRVLDKSLPNQEGGEYDRHDVATICLNFTLPAGAVDGRLLIDGLRPAKLGEPGGEGMPAVGDLARIETTANGFLCKTGGYEARIGKEGALQSLKVGGVEMLAHAAGFLRNGQFVALKTAKLASPGKIVAEGERKDPAKAVAGSPCPFTARVVYRFKTDRIELTLEQSLDQYGGFAWAPSPSVLASYDALVDYAMKPGAPVLYGQTDPRWTTREGPVLRFDFGVWQKGFANANWKTANVEGKSLPCMLSTVPATTAIKAVVYPLAQPSVKDALTFNISAANPDFLLPGGKPVHFDIKVSNAGPAAMAATVRFEVRDYLTQKPVASKSTKLKLASKAEMMLPTDVKVKKPGLYRGAIVIEEAGKVVRDFWWVFTYDFDHYQPATTRPADFDQFWKEALAESAALPLDIKMTPAPDKSNAQVDAFKVSYATLGGRRIYAWYARPKAPGKYPAHIRFPSSGVYPLAGPQIMADRCTLWIVIHGFDVDLSNMPAGDDPGKNYWTAGIESPKTSMWRTIYISLVRAVDFMLAQPEVDAKRVAVMGGSQGGGLALVAASLDHRIGFCMPNHFGLPRLDWTVKHRPGYWPFGMSAKPAKQTEEQFLNTLAYFDIANHAGNIRCPVAAEVGLMDTVTASGNQICALAHVPKKQLYLVCSPWAMHGAGSRDSGLIGPCYTRFLKGENPLPPPTQP